MSPFLGSSFSSFPNELDRRLIVTSTAAFTLGLLIRGFLVSGKRHGEITPSPLKTLLPRLPAEEHAKLPYPPDSLPGARDVVTPYGSIRVYEFGPESGRKVLLVHGISTPCLALGGVAHALVDKGCRVMLFDLFGRGFSENPADLPHDLRLFSTQILLATASSPLTWKKFSIVGYSLGGGISAGFTSYFPEMIDSLVLLCPSGLIRSRHFSKTNRILYSEGVIPEPLLLAMVKRRLKTPLYPPKKHQSQPKPTTDPDENENNNDPKIGTKQAAAAEIPRIESNSTAIVSRSHPNITVEQAVVHQVDHHLGFVAAFMSSIRYGPIQNQHSLWEKLRAGFQQVEGEEKQQKKPKKKILIIAGDRDPIIDAKELKEDLGEVLGGIGDDGEGDGIFDFHVVQAAHDAPIVKAQEISELVWEFWK